MKLHIVNGVLVISAGILAFILFNREGSSRVASGGGQSTIANEAPVSPLDLGDIRKSRVDLTANDYSDPEKQHLREIGLLNSSESPRFNLVGPNGNIAEEALNVVGVSNELKPVLQGYIDTAFQKMAKLAMGNAKITINEQGEEVYDIPRIEGGQKILDELKNNIRSSVGTVEADTLIASFRVADYFGAFGYYQAQLRKGSKPRAYPGQRPMKYVNITYWDPVSGKIAGEASMGVEEYRELSSFPRFFP